MDYIYHYNSILGGITLSSDGTALTGLWFDGQKHFAAGLSKEHKTQYLPVFEETTNWLDIYFGGKLPGFTPPLNPSATPFQKAVWNELFKIPYGETITYGEITKQLAKSGKTPSPRAVGNASSRNPVSIIVPCHRVIGKSGSLTGYAGGLDKKLQLLKLEGINIDLFSIPK